MPIHLRRRSREFCVWERISNDAQILRRATRKTNKLRSVVRRNPSPAWPADCSCLPAAMPRPRRIAPPHPVGRDVTTLLETERRLELRLAEARQEAQRIVDEARRAASTAVPSLADALARREANVDASRRQQETSFGEAAARQETLVEETLATRLQELGKLVVDRLTAQICGGRT